MKHPEPVKILFVFVLIFFASILHGQIANSYPNDSNIQNNSSVIFTEMFETPITGYVNTTNVGNITYDASVPPGSLGTKSAKFTSYHTPSNLNQTEIRKKFSTGISDSVFVRFYVKYNNTHTHHHSGIWLMGANPANPCFPCLYPGRPIPPGGDSAFQVGAELRGSTQIPQTNSRFGFYNYWMGMHDNGSGIYYGNEFKNPPVSDIINTTQWNCIEVMLKLNNPVTDSTGEIKMWINGQLISHYGKGFPIGNWSPLTFTEGAGSPFEGFRWRSTSAVVFNSIWIKNYSATSSDPNPNDILYDHIVVAKKYIGPIYIPTGINQENQSQAIAVYPNPASNELNINGLNAVSDIRIMDLQGRQVVLINNFNSNKIDISTLENGIYFMNVIEKSGNVANVKFVKQ